MSYVILEWCGQTLYILDLESPQRSVCSRLVPSVELLRGSGISERWNLVGVSLGDRGPHPWKWLWDSEPLLVLIMKWAALLCCKPLPGCVFPPQAAKHPGHLTMHWNLQNRVQKQTFLLCKLSISDTLLRFWKASILTYCKLVREVPRALTGRGEIHSAAEVRWKNKQFLSSTFRESSVWITGSGENKEGNSPGKKRVRKAK